MHWVRGGAGAEVVGPPVSGGGASALLRFFVNCSVAYFDNDAAAIFTMASR
jgi:hypothetical protein